MTSEVKVSSLFVAVLAAGGLLAGTANANITITGATAGTSIAGVDSDNDSTVTTTTITYVNTPNAAYQAALAAQFPTWTFNFQPGNGLNGTLNINTYVPTSTGDDNGGGKIDATYTRANTDPTIANLRWVQLVTTNLPLGGGPTTGYIDPLPNDDTLPFYWTNPEDGQALNGNKTATTYHFFDNSSRTPPSGSPTTTWNGALLLASWSDPGGNNWTDATPPLGNRTVTIYDGISWGWSLTDPADAGVPELGTWSLMIIGLAAAGGAMRARRRDFA